MSEKQLTFAITVAATQGGGSNFLRILRCELEDRQLLTTPAAADVIIHNSHHDVSSVLKLRRRHPHTIFLHRIDGPMSDYTERRDARDNVVWTLNAAVADGTIFQSVWSQTANSGLGWRAQTPWRVIHNAPDQPFQPVPKEPPSTARKIRVVTYSWSAHPNKGIATLRWLDHHLDSRRLEVEAWGYGDNDLTRIQAYPAASQQTLAAALQRADIFLFPSRVEACSNAVLEALATGTPVIAYDGSSNREIIQRGGAYFTNDRDIPALIDHVYQRRSEFTANIRVPTIASVADDYIAFARTLTQAARPPHPWSPVAAMKARTARQLQLGQSVLDTGARRSRQLQYGVVERLHSAVRRLRLLFIILRGFRQQFASIKPGDVVIDCGANIGDVTAEFVRRGATVHAFEPNPGAYRYLRRRFRTKPQVQCYQQAVWDEARTLRLFHHQNTAENPIKWSVGSSLMQTKGNVDPRKFSEVDTVDLADFILRLPNDVALLKIDIEGAEYRVMRRLISSGAVDRVRRILVETHGDKIASLNSEHADLAAIVRQKYAQKINLHWT